MRKRFWRNSFFLRPLLVHHCVVCRLEHPELDHERSSGKTHSRCSLLRIPGWMDNRQNGCNSFLSGTGACCGAVSLHRISGVEKEAPSANAQRQNAGGAGSFDHPDGL